MPEVIVKYPDNMFGEDHSARIFFKQVLMTAVADHMSATDPSGEEHIFDAEMHIDLVALPYDELMSNTTASVLLTIVTYDWPDRTSSMNRRLQAICDAVAPYVPADHIGPYQDVVSATFIGKQAGCWAFTPKPTVTA